MSTFATWPVPVAFSLLDVSTGDPLVRVGGSAVREERASALDDAPDAPFRQTRRRGQRPPRTLSISPAALTGPEASLLIDAHAACNGVAGFVEFCWPGGDPALFRFTQGELRLSRGVPHVAGADVTLEEHVTDG